MSDDSTDAQLAGLKAAAAKLNLDVEVLEIQAAHLNSPFQWVLQMSLAPDQVRFAHAMRSRDELSQAIMLAHDALARWNQQALQLELSDSLGCAGPPLGEAHIRSFTICAFCKTDVDAYPEDCACDLTSRYETQWIELDQLLQLLEQQGPQSTVARVRQFYNR